MRGFNHATILSPSFHGLRKERLAQWPSFCDLNTTKNSRGVLPEKLGGSVWHASWNPYPISDQNLWFSLPCFRPDQNFDIQPYFKPEALEHGAWQAVTARIRLMQTLKEKWSYRQMMKNYLLLKKHTQFKTRVHKPYPFSDHNGRNWYPFSDKNG